MAIMAITPAASWIHRVAGEAPWEGLSVIVAYLQRLSRCDQLRTSLGGGASWPRCASSFAAVSAHNACRLGPLLISSTPFPGVAVDVEGVPVQASCTSRRADVRC
jgi:hypothetical protein